MVQIQIKGIMKTKDLMLNLSKELPKAIIKESGKFIGDIRKSAKLRAPRDTGRLANSIIVREQGKNSWVLEVQSPYGVYQERGFTPHFFLADPGRPGFQSNKLQNSFGKLVMVKKHTPFVKPALEHNLSKLSQRMSDATKRGISKARRAR